MDYLYRLALSTLYLSGSTCALKRQVESPTSLGTIYEFSLLPEVRLRGRALSPFLFPSTSGTCHPHHIPDLALVRVTQSLCPSPVTILVVATQTILLTIIAADTGLCLLPGFSESKSSVSSGEPAPISDGGLGAEGADGRDTSLIAD